MGGSKPTRANDRSVVPRGEAPPHWPILATSRSTKLTGSHGLQLVVPPLPKADLTPLLAGLLPNRNHNEDLMKIVESLPKARFAVQSIVAIFAADPFFVGQGIGRRLRERGYHRIVNWPSTAQYGGDFSAALDAVNLGPRREYENLARLAEQGLSISAAICTEAAMTELGGLKPEILFLAPSFDLWADGKLHSDRLLKRCAAVAATVCGNTPIVLMGTGGAIALASAHEAGASGLLIV